MDIEFISTAYLASQGLIYYGKVTQVDDATHFRVASLAGFGDAFFADNFRVYVLRDAGGAGAAPQTEMKPCSAFTSSTSRFTHTAFTVVLAAADEILMLHESLARILDTTYGLSAIKTLIAAIPTTAERGTDNAALASVLGALNSATGSGAVSDAKVAMTYLKQLVTGLITLDAICDTSGVVTGARTAASKLFAGVPQVKATTIDLHQAAATYDLVTGTTQDVIITGLTLRLPNIDVSDDVGGITGITIQTDDGEPVEFITAAMGVIANLTAESQHGREACHILLKATKKIQLTLVGGTADADPTTCDVVITYHAVVDGGYLA